MRGNVFRNCANGGNIFHTFSNGGGSFTADFGFVNYTVENNVFEQTLQQQPRPLRRAARRRVGHRALRHLRRCRI